MNMAYTMAPGRGDTDLLLYRLSRLLLTEGYRPAGTVQINTERDDAGLCDMDVQVLPDGPAIRISQDLGAEARGCRLDPAGLETAVGLAEVELEKGADCLIVNKFGKQEADGRGFRPVMAEALSRDIPVLVGLNRLNQKAFEAFAEGMAVNIPPVEAELASWLREAMRRAPQAG